MQFNALQAISFFKDNRARNIAIEYLRKKKETGGAIQVLVKNFKEADSSLIGRTLWKESSRNEFHYAAMQAVDICKDKKTKSPLKILMPIYKRGYCSNCRERVIKAMTINKTLPKWIQKEAIYDCDLDIRKRVKRYKQK